jgi:hypothetical protein
VIAAAPPKKCLSLELAAMLALHEQYIINDKGKKTAIVLAYKEWEKILEILEEFEDISAYDKVKTQPSDPIPFDTALKSIK